METAATLYFHLEHAYSSVIIIARYDVNSCYKTNFSKDYILHVCARVTHFSAFHFIISFQHVLHFGVGISQIEWKLK